MQCWEISGDTGKSQLKLRQDTLVVICIVPERGKVRTDRTFRRNTHLPVRSIVDYNCQLACKGGDSMERGCKLICSSQEQIQEGRAEGVPNG